MKRIRYIGVSWVDRDQIHPHEYKLTIGKVYEVIKEDDMHYLTKDDDNSLMFVENDPTIFEVVID